MSVDAPADAPLGGRDVPPTGHDVPALRTRTAREVVTDGRRLIGRFVRDQPVVFTLAASGAVAYAAAIVASALVVGRLTDTLIVPVLADGEPAGDRLRAGVLLVLAVAVWKALGIIVRRTTASYLQFRSRLRLRDRLLAHQLRLSLRWYGSRAVGDLLSVSDNDTDRATFMLAPLPFATGVSVLLLIATVAVTVLDPLLGGLAALVLIVVVVVDLRGAFRVFAQMEEEQRRRGRVTRIAHESFDGALTVKALGRADHETDRFRDEADRLRAQLITVGRVSTFYRALTDALPALGTIVLLVAGASRVAAGSITTGDLVTVTYLVTLLAVPIRLIGYLLWDTANSLAGWTRVEQVLDDRDVVAHGAVPSVAPGTAADVAADGLRFGYHLQAPPVLDGLALTIPAGRTIAVVGPTGSGKSTLALLLARLWDPDAGTVRLDGRDLRDLAPGVVPHEVAYVAQSSFLFDDDVRGNVTLGADVDDDRVHEALRLAGAADFVAALPHGLDTRLGERGTTLSGGQQQRLALARALARRPRLLVLDDATSAVDPSIEAAILHRLRDAALPSTVAVVAYRRSSIVLADEVVHVDGGRVVAHGTHAELLRDDPDYAALLQAYELDQAARAADAARAAESAHVAAEPDDGAGAADHASEGRP